jgi:prevent-host-death family protein
LALRKGIVQLQRESVDLNSGCFLYGGLWQGQIGTAAADPTVAAPSKGTLVCAPAAKGSLHKCITSDAFVLMEDITIRDLRNRGGDVVNRVLAGECLTVTRAGKPVAQLRPLPRTGVDSKTLLSRWKNLPMVDGAAFRNEVDDLLDAEL